MRQRSSRAGRAPISGATHDSLTIFHDPGLTELVVISLSSHGSNCSDSSAGSDGSEGPGLTNQNPPALSVNRQGVGPIGRKNTAGPSPLFAAPCPLLLPQALPSSASTLFASLCRVSSIELYLGKMRKLTVVYGAADSTFGICTV
ncbi:hypothetical protein NDU88_005889 [Pleurodeles waltl]|uniref:Uncharacterized protein n=1 Tax=Pleurodeles waltl TaxID=8319 RepID=A0AAV7RQD9_PLEWA|nr:hypothetical protein NDU88_005889 [Pleurodeles waltl]